MVRISQLFLFVLILLFAAGSNAASRDSSYTLGSGDVISINVFGEEDLSFEKLRLTDAGSFSFPFIGELVVKEMTAAQVEDLLIKRLKGDYLIDPKISISVLEYRDFFVNGEVEKPGGYPYKPGLTLRKALAIAGGITDRGSEDKVYVIREGRDEMEPERIEMEASVYPGDIVTVKESLF